MIFHYVSGSALMCEIRIPGLTTRLDGWRVDAPWRDPDYSNPDEDEYLFGHQDPSSWYGGYHHFVCESLSRTAAQRIVTALGGYLVDDSYLSSSRQLGTGGPFYLHEFDVTHPYFLSLYNKIEQAVDRVEREKKISSCQSYRIYDASGFMVMEITREQPQEVECICGHDGKLLSPDCPVPSHQASVQAYAKERRPATLATMSYCPSDLNLHSHAYPENWGACRNCGWDPQQHSHLFTQRPHNVFDTCNLCGLPSGASVHQVDLRGEL